MASVKTQGCTLALGDGASPEVFTSVINLVSFQGPSGSRQVIDATTLASTAKEKDVGIPDLGQITFDYNFSSADAALIDGRLVGNTFGDADRRLKDAVSQRSRTVGASSQLVGRDHR